MEGRLLQARRSLAHYFIQESLSTSGLDTGLSLQVSLSWWELLSR